MKNAIILKLKWFFLFLKQPDICNILATFASLIYLSSLIVITHPYPLDIPRVTVSDHMFTTPNEWFSYYLPMRKKLYAHLFWANHHKSMTKKILQQEVRVCSAFLQKRWRAGEEWEKENKIIGGKGCCRFSLWHCLFQNKNYLACEILVSSDIIEPLRMWCFRKFKFDSVLRL